MIAPVSKTLVQASIQRSNHKMIVAVLAHEVPILKALHLPENVEVLNEEYDVLTVDGSAEAEFGRLCKKYDDAKTEVVRRVYGSPAQFATVTDFKTAGLGASAPAAPQALVRDDAEQRKQRIKASKEPAKAKA